MKPIIACLVIQSNLTMIPYSIQNQEEPIPYTQTQSSEQPFIHVHINDRTVEQQVGICQETTLTIHVEAIQEDTIQAFVDGELIPMGQTEKGWTLPIKPGNRILEIAAKDLDGNDVLRRIEIESIQNPFLSTEIQKDSYQLKPDPLFLFEENSDFEYVCVNETTSQVMTGEVIKETRLNLQEPGTYTFTIRHKKYPYIQFDISRFHFTNTKPSGSIQIESVTGSKDIILHLQKDSEWLKEAYLEIRGNQGVQTIPFTDTYRLKAQQGKDVTVVACLVVRDLFGQEYIQKETIRMDSLAPDISLEMNGNVIRDSIVYFDSIRQIEAKISEEGNIKYTGVRNGQSFPIENLSDLLNGLLPEEGMDVILSATDMSGNQSSQTIRFIKNGIVQPVVASPVTELIKEENVEEKIEDNKVVTRKTVSPTDYQLEQKEYSLDENNHIVFKQKVIKENQRPSITIRFFTPKNNKLKFLMKKKQSGYKNKVVWIKVNGKKIKVRKPKSDTLGNWIYEIDLNEKKNDIQIKVKNEKGYEKRIEKTVVLQNEKNKTHSVLSWVQELIWKMSIMMPHA